MLTEYKEIVKGNWKNMTSDSLFIPALVLWVVAGVLFLFAQKNFSNAMDSLVDKEEEE